MILKIRIENMKDATGKKKRVLMASLRTEIIGMEMIDTVAELDDDCVLGKEITLLTTNMLALKKKALEKEHARPSKTKKLKTKVKKK